MIKPLTVEGGAYEFTIPTSFLPKYAEHEVLQNYRVPSMWYNQSNENKSLTELIPEYTFNYDFQIKSTDKIIFVGAPSDSVT